MPEKLPEIDVLKHLSQLPGWVVKDGKLHREYQFPDFAHAIGFMTIAAPAIEKIDHHPEWSNVYNRVTVNLVTHSANGITVKDFHLANLLEGIAKKLA